MFEYITGKLTFIYPTEIVVDVGGVGYLLQVANPYAFSSQLNQRTTIYVYQAVREDAITLFGFRNIDEKRLFLKLISVSGIGPKSALSILASDDNEGLVNAIEQNNVSYLTKFPGVGKKTAGQLVLDLKGKLGTVNVEAVPNTTQSGNEELLNEVSQALSGLGYSAKEIQKVLPTLKEQNHTTTQSALSAAFKLLLGGK